MLEKGQTYTSRITVTTGNTAATLGSGDMNVFATPALVALMENAAMSCVAPHLPESSTTVGAQINTSHIKPSPVGATVTATATLTAVEGRKLTFNVIAYEGKSIIGEGTHIRFIVDRSRFLAKLCSKD